jgi:tetratricopeptide (TPR) repeat protein|tara:strand:+ start:1964 stop:2560 length:597 start_codon:yes stop_codon:yes gene_type:complete
LSLNKIKHHDPIYNILVRISFILFVLFTGWLLWDHFINRPPEIRHYLSGNNAFKDQNYSISLDHYLKAYNYNNEDVYVIEGIARSYMQLKDYQKSKDYFNLAIKIDPNFAPSYANLGVLYDREKDYVNAIKFYEKALSLDQELSIGMHWIDRLLYDVRETPSTIGSRLDYLKLQMDLPEDKRLLSVKEIDQQQINYEK